MFRSADRHLEKTNGEGWEQGYHIPHILCYSASHATCHSQSSQVDLLAKSEMLEGIAVVFDAEGVTPLGGSGHAPPENFEKLK